MRLVAPSVDLARSFLAAHDEFVAAGEEVYARLPSMPAEGAFPGVDFTREALEDPAAFALLVAFHEQQADDDAPRPRAYVAATERWMVEAGEYVGRISLRHELNALLLEWGGHIGYAVRPSARRRGHATEALRQMLVICRERGLDEVLITCDEDNHASRRVIEGAGGDYEDSREGKRRYWVPVA